LADGTRFDTTGDAQKLLAEIGRIARRRRGYARFYAYSGELFAAVTTRSSQSRFLRFRDMLRVRRPRASARRPFRLPHRRPLCPATSACGRR
jgi:hypothetical protein